METLAPEITSRHPTIMNIPHPATTPTTITTEHDRSLLHKEMEHFMEDGYTFDVNEHKSTFHNNNNSGTSTSTSTCTIIFAKQHQCTQCDWRTVFPTTTATKVSSQQSKTITFKTHCRKNCGNCLLSLATVNACLISMVLFWPVWIISKPFLVVSDYVKKYKANGSDSENGMRTMHHRNNKNDVSKED